MRILLAALAFFAISFVAGVAGDLSRASPAHGAAVTLRIPPAIPADAVRAAPLPLPVLAISAASASEPAREPDEPAPGPVEALEPKPSAAHFILGESSKIDTDAEAKAKERKHRA